MIPCEDEQKAVSDLKTQVAQLEAQLQKSHHSSQDDVFSEKLVELKSDLANAEKRLQQCLSEWVDGTMRPKYKILTVLYAPPGTDKGNSETSVDYGSESTTGTTTSISNSFSEGSDVSLNVKAGNDISPISGEGETEFDTARTSTDTNSTEVKKSASSDIKVNGPAADGIDHNRDEIWLWLNPLILVSTNGKDVIWSLSMDGSIMDIVYVYVGWLKGVEDMPQEVDNKLTAAGITPDDYPNILAADPFASGDVPIDQDRFLPLPRIYPYIPPFSANDTVPTQTFKQTNEVTKTSSHKVEKEYDVKTSVSGSDTFLGFFKVTIKISGTMTWKDSSETGTSSDTTQSATFTLGGPSFGYQGPIDVLVYWDTIYNSFMFAFPTESPSYSYKLIDKNTGQPILHNVVAVTFGTEKFMATTDARGEFRIYGASPNQVGIGSVQGRQIELIPIKTNPVTSIGPSKPISSKA
jgi:hypothetical protein